MESTVARVSKIKVNKIHSMPAYIVKFIIKNYYSAWCISKWTIKNSNEKQIGVRVRTKNYATTLR